MADPGLSGSVNPKSRGADLLVWPFFPENYMKLKNCNEPRGWVCASLWKRVHQMCIGNSRHICTHHKPAVEFLPYHNVGIEESMIKNDWCLEYANLYLIKLINRIQ